MTPGRVGPSSAPIPPVEADDGPVLAVPPRPRRPLSTLALLRTATTNTLSICDDALFEQPIVQRRYGGFPVAFVSDPAGIRRVLVEAASDYPRLAAIRRLYAAEIGTGTLATDGELWERHRRVGAPTLDRRAVTAELPSFILKAEAAADALREQSAGEVFNVEATMTDLVTRLLNQVLTGDDPRGIPILTWLSRVPRWPRLLDIVPLPGWLANRLSPAKQSPERAAIRDVLLTLVRERLDPGYAGPRDLVWRVAHAVDRNTGEPLPVLEIRDEASSLVAAGDATIRPLTWIWYLLALHPRVEERLHEELDRVLGDAPPRPDQLRDLPYARQVLDEVMRLYPPVPLLVRQARRSDRVCGRRIPRGSVVIVSPWVVHRHRRLWTDPDLFDPDRFEASATRDRPALAFIPFSAGPRTCSGTGLANLKMLIIVAAFARRYRIRLAPDRPIIPRGGITLKPRGGLWVTMEPR